MITELHIRDRFVRCLKELSASHTQKEIAASIGVTQPYLSGLSKSQNPQIPAAAIANFCLKYHYSPHYILTGKGDKKGQGPLSKDEKWEIERGKYLDLIGKLLEGLLELKAEFNDPLTQLVNQAGKKVNKQ